MSVWVFPSGDIHLVRAATPNTVDIRVVTQVPGNRNGAWEDASTLDTFRVLFQQAAAGTAGVTHAITPITGSAGLGTNRGVPVPATISPSAVSGSSIHRVIVAATSPAFNQPGLMRVTTHDDVTALFSGDDMLKVFAGETNRVLTVYAQFGDGAFEDVTGHPWLRYTPAHPDLVTVDAEGRLTGVSAGNSSIRVTTWDGQFAFDVPIIIDHPLSGFQFAAFVVDELNRKTSRHAITVYVVAEGYDNQERFFTHARKVVSAWLGNSPYKRLADRFHAIGVFRHSVDRGITIGPRLITEAGLAATERILWEPADLTQVDPAHLPGDRLRTRETSFGLMVGSRVASNPKLASAVGGGDLFRRFLFPRSVARSIQVDDRRLPRFGLDDPNGFVPIPPNVGFTDYVRRWLAAANQNLNHDDRVAFLVDDELYAGMNLDVMDLRIPHQPMIAVTCGKEPKIGGVTAFGPLFARGIRTASLDPAATGSRFAHELAHTYRLADEYENDRRRVYDATGDSVDEVERADNVQHDSTLRSPGTTNPLRGDPAAQPAALPAGSLDVTKIKWNIHRVAKMSPTSKIVPAAGGTHRVTVAAGQAVRWKSGERAFLRNSLSQVKDVKTEQRTVALAVQIITNDPAQNTVDIRLPAGTSIAALGDKPPLLYVPKVDGGVDQSMIHPAVLAHLATHGPFPKPSPCNGGTRETWNNDVECPPISGFSRPSNNADAIGLYEGGADLSCDVFRPSGRCKMRKLMDEEVTDTTGVTIKTKIVVVGFCFVCKYVLVDLIDPSKHEGLDSEYPRDC